MKLKLTLVAAVAIFGALVIEAAPGRLDTSFGNGGIVVTTISDYYVVPQKILEQPDGKILACGMTYEEQENYVSYFLARYNPNGTLDTSFGINGMISESIAVFDGLSDIALQPDGKIIIVGSYAGMFGVRRYNANGTLDASFGVGGLVYTNGTLSAQSVALQPNGKIVVAGSSYAPFSSITDFTVVRYNPNGSLDSSFNGTGIVYTSFGSNAWASGVVLQPDGKIVATGSTGTGSVINFALARYNTNGSLDSGFGTGGKVIYSVGGLDWISEAVLQPDGKIITNGYTADSPGGIARSVIVRFSTNGSIDTGFAQNGIFTSEVSFDIGRSIALQSDGKLLAFGFAGNVTGFAITRLNPNGTPDLAFGNNGRVITSNQRVIEAGTLQSNGKILAVGASYGVNSIEIARYFGSRPAQFDFDGDLRADLSVFRSSDTVWYLNRSTDGFSAVQFGISTDKITPADFDGDGKTDIAVYRDGAWYWLNSSTNSFSAFQFGLAADIPQPDDYTGDGRDELAVYRNGTWWMLDLANGQVSSVQFGLASDKPVPADYDGDGRIDQAVYRGNGEWYLNRSSQGFAAVNFGLATDKPVASDYDGDGRTDIAVFRPSDGNWYIKQSSNNVISATNWGLASDIPVPGDYDGDGRADIAVYRNGVWYVVQSSNGSINAQHFGLSSDIPIASVNIQ